MCDKRTNEKINMAEILYEMSDCFFKQQLLTLGEKRSFCG